jgi:ubiquinone/menaquinone biosynthesis C-methylase UbiE
LTFPFPENYFDVFHCRAVLMHVPDTMAVLAEIKRVLKPGEFCGHGSGLVI